MLVDEVSRVLRAFKVFVSKHRMIDVFCQDNTFHRCISSFFVVFVEEVWIIKVGLELTNIAIEIIHPSLIRC